MDVVSVARTRARRFVAKRIELPTARIVIGPEGLVVRDRLSLDLVASISFFDPFCHESRIKLGDVARLLTL